MGLLLSGSSGGGDWGLLLVWLSSLLGLGSSGSGWLLGGLGSGGLIHGGFLSGDIGRLLGGLSGSPLFQELLVLILSLLGLQDSVSFFFLLDFLGSKSGVGDDSLDLGGFLSLLSAGGLPGSSDGKLGNQDLSLILVILVVLDLEVFSDLGGSLRSQSSWLLIVGKSFDFFVSLLGDGDSEDSDIRIDDASSDGLSLSLSGSSGSVAGVSLGHEDLGSSLGEDTLFHGESLFVVSSSNLEDISLVLISEAISWHFLSHSLVKEDGAFLIIIDFDDLLSSSLWATDVEFHAGDSFL